MEIAQEIFESMLNTGEIELDDICELKKDQILEAATQEYYDREADRTDFQAEMAWERHIEKQCEEMERRKIV